MMYCWMLFLGAHKLLLNFVVFSCRYNGRVLKGARVTTSWLDIRQFRELGMPDALKHQMNLMATNFAKEKQAGRGRLGFRRGRGRGRGRGRSPALSSDQEFSYSSRSQSGTDSESVDSFSFGSKPHRPSTPSGQGSSFKFLDAPKEGRRERLESSERPSSRTSSHSQSSWNEGDREGPRKRKDPSPPVNYGKGKDVDGGEKGSEKKKAVSQMLYVPRSKRKMEDGGESPGVDMKSVFDRLGPTKDQEKDLHQLETFGDVATKKSKPNDSSLLSPKTLSKEGSPKSVSATPEKESVTLAVGAVDDGKKENSRRSSERDDKKGRSSRHGSEHDSSRHKRSRKKSASDKDRPKSKERTDREKVKAEHGDTVKQSMRREAHVSTPTTPSDINAAIEDPGTPPLPPEPSVPPTYDPQWLEYYRQASNQGQVQDLAQGHLDPSTMGPAGDGEQVPSQWTAALGKKQRSSSASSKLGLKRVDKEAALAVLQVRPCI